MLRRRLVWGALALVLVGAAGVVFGLPRWVKGKAVAAAAARGFDAQIGDVRFGSTRVWLKDVDLRHQKVHQLHAKLPLIEVRVGGFAPRAVLVHGGHFRVEGTRSSLLDSLRAVRGASQPAARVGSGVQLTAGGISLEWQPSPSETYYAWGLRYERSGVFVKLGADLLRVDHSAASLESKGLRLEMKRPGYSLESISANETQGTIRLGSLPALVAQLGGANAGDDDPVSIDADADEPAGAPSGAEPPAERGATATFLDWLSLEPDRGRRLRDRLASATSVLANRLPENSEVDFEDLRLRLQGNDSGLNIGPGRMRLSRGATALSGSFIPDFQERQGVAGISLAFRSAIEDGPVEVKLSGGPINLSQLGVQDGDFGLSHVGRANLELETSLVLSPDGNELDVSSRGSIDGLTLWQPRLASEPIVDFGLNWEGSAEATLDGSHFKVDSGQVRVGAVSAKVDLSITRQPENLTMALSAAVPLASCQSMFDSLPEAFQGQLAGTKLDGTFSWKFSVFADTNHLDQMKARWRMQNDCVTRRVPAAISPDRFKQPFNRVVVDADGGEVGRISGPGSASWTPIQEISRYMEVAVTVTEDRGFWRHRGFDQRAIESSIRQNVQEGRFVRGASTISMQLAKNLYLARDKNIARKVQEALLTMLLEQELRKDEILELYFNVIEFGPGLYGIKAAADHYFDAEPIELSLAQCFYLASLLPNPKLSRFRQDGSLKPSWAGYIRRLVRIAHRRGQISEEELEEGLAQDLRFGEPYEPPVVLPGSGIPDDPAGVGMPPSRDESNQLLPP